MREQAAYRMMIRFLEDRYERLPSDALGGLLGELNLLPDGTPADPAVSADWDRAVANSDRKGADASGTLPMRKAG